MATFRVVTPLKDGPASTMPPGAVVELSDTDAAPLLLCGAIEATDDQEDPGDPDEIERQAQADAAKPDPKDPKDPKAPGLVSRVIDSLKR